MSEIRVGAVLNGKWRIDRLLGAGGTATVFAATHRNGNRVALKVLKPSLSCDASICARFRREGYVANSVGHPGVVKILDDDVTEAGALFLVMELLEGETLERRRLRLGGKLPLAEVFTVGEQVLDLLAAAHDRRIFHRDIKPANVFVTNEGAVKLLDFGIARMNRSSDERTASGLFLGTPEFMSPEQVLGEDVDGRADLWSLGASLFFLLSGEVVHAHESAAQQLIATATSTPRSLASVAPLAPAPLVGVVDRALALRREDRWPDARAMRNALRLAYQGIGCEAESPIPAPFRAIDADMEETLCLPLDAPNPFASYRAPAPSAPSAPPRQKRKRALLAALPLLLLPFLGYRAHLLPMHPRAIATSAAPVPAAAPLYASPPQVGHK
jgi:eukaryotic-like serine/threonine-protein kinase